MDSLVATTRATLAVQASLAARVPVPVAPPGLVPAAASNGATA
jgi:hypothetical protein